MASRRRRQRWHGYGNRQHGMGEDYQAILRGNLLHLCAAYGRAAAVKYCIEQMHFDMDE